MNTPSSSVGRLYVVATPIGNLADLSPRAAQILAQVALIACEDTRHSQVLLRAIGVNTPLTALHDHNESTKLNSLLERLQQGQDVALISDAGTPLISDPGFKLIQAAALRQIEIITVPGPSAVTAALSIAGLPTDRFVFEGFLPAQDAALKKRLDELRHEPRTMVFYEAPHRIKNTLKIAAECFGALRPAALLRELTKRHETVVRAPLQALATLADSDANMARGEQVLVIQGAEPMDALAATPAWHAALELFLTQLSVRTAVDWVCELYAVKRNEVYERALALKQSGAVSDTNA
jgi:16S rRNA (cytidine1402-2'-O)-methyltransferase